jgi:4-hydroxythreonine-4-phosphate dehydrogenase
MGDPAGVGPEIVLKALQNPDVHQHCRPVVVGDRWILERAAAWVGIQPKFEVITAPANGDFDSGMLTLIDLHNAPPEDCPVGEVSAAGGKAAVAYVQQACDLALAGEVAAIVTAPLNKESINLGGFSYPGHTELLKERTNAKQVTMLLVGPDLRVVHVSTHVPLAQAIELVKKERVEEVILLAYDACRALGIAQPRIAVAGLNPHAGEAGLFGEQEQREILPAVGAARAKGIEVSDPQPPDTVFLRATKGFYDIVVAMYHDQGHIPMKLLAFDEGVNVSIGLPIIRTSVDHGTAFDIAGTGQAKESSLLAAIDVAVQMVNAREASN